MIKKIVFTKENDEDVELTLDEARELFRELNELFDDNQSQPVYVPYYDPYKPYQPYWDIKPSWDKTTWDGDSTADHTHYEYFTTDGSSTFGVLN